MKPGHAILYCLLSVGIPVGVAAAAQALPDSVLAEMDAGVIAAVADGDFVAGSYASGELAPGRRLFAVALPGGAPAKLADTIELDDLPEALDVSPDGRIVAVVSNNGGKSLLYLVPFSGKRFGAAQEFVLRALLDSGESGDIHASNVAWHPSGRFLAINLNTSDRILFVALERGGAAGFHCAPGAAR